MPHLDIKIPSIPDEYWKNHVLHYYTPKEIEKMYKTIQWYLKTRYQIYMDINKIRQRVGKHGLKRMLMMDLIA